MMSHSPSLRRLPALLLAAAVLAGLAAQPAGAAAFTHDLSLDAERLEMANLIGTFRVEPAAGDRYEVSIAVQGADADPELITIHVEEGHEARVDIRFPVSSHRDYVYPALGRGKASISRPGDRPGESWIIKLIRGLGSERITVRGSGQGLEVWADVTVRVPAGRTTELRLGVGSSEAARTDGELSLYTRSGTIAAAGHRGSLRLDTGSGGVRAEEVDGPLHVDTGSGAVEVAGQRGGPLHVDTGSGGVSIEGADTENLYVDTGSGSVTAHRIKAGKGRIDTGSGSVVLDLESHGDGPFVIDTGSGGVRLGLPAAASATISVDVGSGGIRHDVPGIEVLAAGRGNLEARVGDGRAKFTIDTGSGGVTITGR
jgi:hypothetical protein